MLVVVLSCVVLVALTTLIHYEVLHYVHATLPRVAIRNQTKLLLVMFAAFAAHAVEIALYGVTLFGLVRYGGVGDLSSHGGLALVNSLYFSAETYTSLGFGDLVPVGPVRLLAGTEALNGLVLIGWTASYAYIAMERFWTSGGRPPAA
ncbi:MAG: potassium channel family protein [Casimicrobiaceae bacterium]